MNTHAQALGRLGGLANKGKPKSEAHKAALRKVLDRSRIAQDVSETLNPVPIPQTKPRKCQTPYCTKEGHERSIHGFKAWCCDVHWGGGMDRL